MWTDGCAADDHLLRCERSGGVMELLDRLDLQGPRHVFEEDLNQRGGQEYRDG